jgi:hypothetical protein
MLISFNRGTAFEKYWAQSRALAATWHNARQRPSTWPPITPSPAQVSTWILYMKYSTLKLIRSASTRVVDNPRKVIGKTAYSQSCGLDHIFWLFVTIITEGKPKKAKSVIPPRKSTRLRGLAASDVQVETDKENHVEISGQDESVGVETIRQLAGNQLTY